MSAEIVHSNEESVPFEVLVSVTVGFPTSLKWNSSKRGSPDGETVALTKESISQVLPTMLIRFPKSFVSLDKMEPCDIRMYVDLSPFSGRVFHSLISLPSGSYGSLSER